MDKPEIYLDNNATTQPLPQVLEAILDVLGPNFGNPSSAHSSGDRARCFLAKSRERVANLIQCDFGNLIFTSSGTEANNMVLLSSVESKGDGCEIITTPVEHSSILKTCEYLEGRGVKITYLPVDSHGLISLSDLNDAISNKTALVSIQWVNNETGVIQSIRDILKICQSHGIPFHTDAAQAVGKLSLDLDKLNLDFLTLTAHKFHGPPGTGAVYAKNLNALKPLIHGGPQEFKLRPGTENLAGIVGMGKAAELRSKNLDNTVNKIQNLRDLFEEKILESIPNCSVNGNRNHRVCNTTNILFEGISGQALVARLDQEDVRCSQSSACMNMRPEPSYVLRAMGLSEEEAYSSIRFSFSEQNTVDEINEVVKILSVHCKKLQSFSTLLNEPN